MNSNDKRNLLVTVFVTLGLIASVVLAQTTIAGGGSATNSPVFVDWASAFSANSNGISVTYNSTDLPPYELLRNNTANFAVSEIINSTFPEYKAIPSLVGALVPILNLELPRTLVLTGEVLSKIYMGQIFMWNHPEIQALNPTIILPAQFIIVIFRQDTCGTNEIFTEALSSFSPAWKAAFGASQTFPAALRGPTFFGTSSQEMITYVRAIKFSIGYESVALTYQRGIDYIHLINKAGNVVDAEISTLSAALVNATVDPNTLVVSNLIDTEAPFGWPITFVSYVLVPNTFDLDTISPTKCNQLAATLYFISWTGRSYMGNLLSNKHVEIPVTAIASLQDVIFSSLEAITCNGKVMFDRNFTQAPQDPIFPDYDDFPDYSPTSLQGLSPFYNDLGSPIDTSQASSYKFDDFGTSIYLQDDGLLVPSDEVSSDNKNNNGNGGGSSSSDASSLLASSFLLVLVFIALLF